MWRQAGLLNTLESAVWRQAGLLNTLACEDSVGMSWSSEYGGLLSLEMSWSSEHAAVLKG